MSIAQEVLVTMYTAGCREQKEVLILFGNNQHHVNDAVIMDTLGPATLSFIERLVVLFQRWKIHWHTRLGQ